MLTKKQANKLKCLDLLDLAKTDEIAASELRYRALHWSTCAVGEQAAKLKVSAIELVEIDTNLLNLGKRFYNEVNAGFYGKAKRTSKTIDCYVKKQFPNKTAFKKAYAKLCE